MYLKHKQKTISLIIFMLILTIYPVGASSITLSPNDNVYIDDSLRNQNLVNDDILKSRWTSSGTKYPYLKFYVPEYTESATINLFMSKKMGGSDILISRTSPDWNESEITFDSGRPTKDRWQDYGIDTVSLGSEGEWVSFNVSSVVDGPGYYSFMIRASYGTEQWYNSSRASANTPYMQIVTRDPDVDINYNDMTKDSSYAFVVNEGDSVAFSISPEKESEVVDYSWYVNKEDKSIPINKFDFNVPKGDVSYPSTCIWEIRAEATYANGTVVSREWLISSLSESQAPEFIDYFIDMDNRWRTGYISDPWGRELPSYSHNTNFINNGYYTGSSTSTGALLSTKFDINYGTYKFKIRNPGALTVSYFKVDGEPEARYIDSNEMLAPSWRMELTSNEFHDYFSILNYRIAFGDPNDSDGRYNSISYIPISRRYLGQAPGAHWWVDDEWLDITIIRTEDGWWSAWQNDVMLPHSYAHFEDAFNNATKLTLASNGVLEMDGIEIYEDKYIYPKTNIQYGTYAKWWYVGEPSGGRYDPVDSEGIVVFGRALSLQQIVDGIDDSSLITYDVNTRTAVLKTDLSFTSGSEFVMDGETLIVDTSDGSKIIDIKPGVMFKVYNSKITATSHPIIWNIVSSVSSEVFDPSNTRDVTNDRTARYSGTYDFRGSFIVDNSIIDNTGNLFLDAPYEVSIKDTVFSNHSAINYGDYTLRGTYESHNQKIRQSYGEKGFWIVPRMDLTTYEVSNISFVDPKTDMNLKVIGGQWIQNATTLRDSDLSNIDIVVMKALKYEYYVTYNEKDESSTLALLNSLYDESKLKIAGHPRADGTTDYDYAAIEAKYYTDVRVEDSNGTPLANSIVGFDSSNPSYMAENLYEYRDYIIDAYGPGQGGVTNYGSDSPQSQEYSGGVHTRWYNALTLGSATTDFTGHTALPTSSDKNNSIVLADFVLTSDNGVQKKEELSYDLNVDVLGYSSLTLSDISPDATWYRENPAISAYTITAVIPDNSTAPHITGFAPADSNTFSTANTKTFRVWADESFTTMKWYVDGIQVSSSSLEYSWTILEGSHNILFEGRNSNGVVFHTWDVTGSSVAEQPPTTSGTGLSFTPTAPTFESEVGQSTNFVVSSDQTFTSSTWYFNDAEVASGATTYTHNWNTAGTHEVRFDGTAAAGTISRTWTVTVPEPANTGVSSVSIAPSSTVVAPGESFSLDVYIDPGQPLSGSQFNLQYNSIVTATSVQDCGLFSVADLASTFNSGEIDNVNSAITGVYSAIVGSGTISEACAMATVDMVAGSTSGIVDFTLSNVVLSDANSAPAPYDVSYASVLVDTAPEFNALSSVKSDETESISFTVGATDAEGDELTYSATSLPGSAIFDANTATFTWTPDVGDAGTYTASFAVTDGYLNDSVSVTITVEELNNAPVITLFEPADGTEFEEGSIVDINVAGTDSDGQSLSYIIKINGDIVSTGQSYSWTTDYSSAGTYTITAIVSDGIDDVSSTHTITITDLHPRWDVNEDGSVNVLDITLVGQNYGLTYTSELPRWDVNQDGTINVQDLSIVSGHFGETV